MSSHNEQTGPPASAIVGWINPIPELTYNRAGESRPRTEPSSTCYDRGDSTHLQSTLTQRPCSLDAPSLQSTEELLIQVGSGIDSQDAHLQFFSIPCVTSRDNLLEQALRKATKRFPGHDGQKFIPIGDFDEIITQDSVRKEIQSWLPKDRNLDIWTTAVWDTFEYFDPVMKRQAFTSRRKIFAILALFNAQTKISSFIRENLFDKDLPFILNNENKWLHYPNGNPDMARNVECLNELSGQDADSFDSYQWLMLSPIFNMADDKVIFYDLHPRITLPFLELERGQDPALIGGQGEVCRVKIEESHYILNRSTGDQPKDFAIKKLVPRNKGQFDSEVESLKRFSNSGHPHLIKLLATYFHGTQSEGRYYHLIFPWADGNLRHFWKRHPKPAHDYELLLWIAGQCRGIAEGLRMIHNNEFEKSSLKESEVKKGRHGDIKPENILWFKDSSGAEQSGNGILKISDFGLTHWHRDVSSNKTDGEGVFVSKTYRAPEYDLKNSPTQSWDIWALACLYLEFLTWYLHGWESGVDEFSDQRGTESASLSHGDNCPIKEDHFFNLTRGSESTYEASLKCQVIIWVNKLHATEGCSQFIHDFLDLISDHMLRIRPANRHESKLIAERLDSLYDKCKGDKLYCHESAHGQRKKKRNGSDPPDLHDTAVVDFSEEMTEQLHQTISVDNTAAGRNSYHDQVAETEFRPSAHDSFSGYETQQDLIHINSDGSVLDGEQTESPLPSSPTSHMFPFLTSTPPAVPISQPANPESQIVSDDPEQSLIPSSIKIQVSTDSTTHLPRTERSGSSMDRTPENSINHTPNDEMRRDIPSERGRASSQTTRNDDVDPPTRHIQQHSPSHEKGTEDVPANERRVDERRRTLKQKLKQSVSKRLSFPRWLASCFRMEEHSRIGE